MELFAPTIKDAYKIGHKDQYAKGTEVVYSNLTARSNTHSNVPDSQGVSFIGLQFVIKDILIDRWNNTFFLRQEDTVVNQYKNIVSHVLGYAVPVEHIRALHQLGYLPIEIRALKEGSFVPYKVPLFTIYNTLPEFYWVTNMLETMLSAETWGMITSATTYREYRKNFIKYAKETGASLEGVPFQAHDFSMRGMSSSISAAMSGFAALAGGSYGTDTLPAIQLAQEYYNADLDGGIVGCSVNATEHSVMCSNSKDDEIGTFRRLLTETYPEGILSIVSDTWDFWKVVTEYLPTLGTEIMAREGMLVIRPDSGDPVKIITGYTDGEYCTHEGKLYEWFDEEDLPEDCVGKELQEHELKGLIECLWDTFGGTTNEKGYKELDEHIGAIYGDAITLERQVEILERLKNKGFSSGNIVLGVGSYTYQMVTRDTHGMAIKATYVEIDGEGVEIFKDPKTDDGTKKSAKGLMCVLPTSDGESFRLVDQVPKAVADEGYLEVVFKDGKLCKEYTLEEVRETVKSFEDF